MKHSQVSNKSESFNVVTLVLGGTQACLNSIFTLFKNANESYPIIGLADGLNRALCHTRGKGWMYHRVFRTMLLKKRELRGDLQNREQPIYHHNVFSHDETNEL